MKILKNKISDYLMLYKLPFWISAFCVGIIATYYAKGVHFAEQTAKNIYSNHPEWFYLLSPILCYLSFVIIHFTARGAKGSGIPQVMAAVEMLEKGIKPKKMVPLLGMRVFIAKIGSSLLLLLGGGAIGREGPTLQIAASLFYTASQKFNFFKQYVRVETWVITGAAAGLAAAFNTPLGGLVYAMEELSFQHLNKYKSSLITAVIIAGFTAQIIQGPYLFLGLPKLTPMELSHFPLILLVSIVAGMLGAIFGKCIFVVTVWRGKCCGSSFLKLSLVAISASIIILILVYFGNSQSLGPGKDLLVKILFENEKVELQDTLLRFFAPILAYIVGGAGGIFAPSLTTGAYVGNLISQFLGQTDAVTFSVFGMIAFLTGVTRAPFTSFILVLEMTDRHSAIFPMMLSAVLAQNAARLIGHHSVYELLKNTYLITEEVEAPDLPRKR